MRRLYRVDELDFSRAAIRWGEHKGRWRKVVDGVYAEGADDPSPLEIAIGTVVATEGVASGNLAAVLLGLDGVAEAEAEADVTVGPGRSPRRGRVRRRLLAASSVITVEGVRCTDGLQTLIDLAADLDDLRWEEVLESALRRRLVSIASLREAAGGRQPGVARMRRVLAARPAGAPPTESLLETRMVQVARTVEELSAPARQLRVTNGYGEFVARIDLAWPDIGLFVELDGQHHRGQPVYDARRESAIVAATGWLCGRFCWKEVVHLRNVTARRLGQLADQARRRPLPR